MEKLKLIKPGVYKKFKAKKSLDSSIKKNLKVVQEVIGQLKETKSTEKFQFQHAEDARPKLRKSMLVREMEKVEKNLISSTPHQKRDPDKQQFYEKDFSVMLSPISLGRPSTDKNILVNDENNLKNNAQKMVLLENQNVLSEALKNKKKLASENNLDEQTTKRSVRVSKKEQSQNRHKIDRRSNSPAKQDAKFKADASFDSHENSRVKERDKGPEKEVKSPVKVPSVQKTAVKRTKIPVRTASQEKEKDSEVNNNLQSNKKRIVSPEKVIEIDSLDHDSLELINKAPRRQINGVLPSQDQVVCDNNADLVKKGTSNAKDDKEADKSAKSPNSYLDRDDSEVVTKAPTRRNNGTLPSKDQAVCESIAVLTREYNASANNDDLDQFPKPSNEKLNRRGSEFVNTTPRLRNNGRLRSQDRTVCDNNAGSVNKRNSDAQNGILDTFAKPSNEKLIEETSVFAKKTVERRNNGRLRSQDRTVCDNNAGSVNERNTDTQNGILDTFAKPSNEQLIQETSEFVNKTLELRNNGRLRSQDRTVCDNNAGSAKKGNTDTKNDMLDTFAKSPNKKLIQEAVEFVNKTVKVRNIGRLRSQDRDCSEFVNTTPRRQNTETLQSQDQHNAVCNKIADIPKISGDMHSQFEKADVGNKSRASAVPCRPAEKPIKMLTRSVALSPMIGQKKRRECFSKKCLHHKTRKTGSDSTPPTKNDDIEDINPLSKLVSEIASKKSDKIAVDGENQTSMSTIKNNNHVEKGEETPLSKLIDEISSKKSCKNQGNQTSLNNTLGRIKGSARKLIFFEEREIQEPILTKPATPSSGKSFEDSSYSDINASSGCGSDVVEASYNFVGGNRQTRWQIFESLEEEDTLDALNFSTSDDVEPLHSFNDTASKKPWRFLGENLVPDTSIILPSSKDISSENNVDSFCLRSRALRPCSTQLFGHRTETKSIKKQYNKKSLMEKAVLPEREPVTFSTLDMSYNENLSLEYATRERSNQQSDAGVFEKSADVAVTINRKGDKKSSAQSEEPVSQPCKAVSSTAITTSSDRDLSLEDVAHPSQKSPGENQKHSTADIFKRPTGTELRRERNRTKTSKGQNNKKSMMEEAVLPQRKTVTSPALDTSYNENLFLDYATKERSNQQGDAGVFEKSADVPVTINSKGDKKSSAQSEEPVSQPSKAVSSTAITTSSDRDLSLEDVAHPSHKSPGENEKHSTADIFKRPTGTELRLERNRTKTSKGQNNKKSMTEEAVLPQRKTVASSALGMSYNENLSLEYATRERSNQQNDADVFGKSADVPLTINKQLDKKSSAHSQEPVSQPSKAVSSAAITSSDGGLSLEDVEHLRQKSSGENHEESKAVIFKRPTGPRIRSTTDVSNILLKIVDGGRPVRNRNPVSKLSAIVLDESILESWFKKDTQRKPRSKKAATEKSVRKPIGRLRNDLVEKDDGHIQSETPRLSDEQMREFSDGSMPPPKTTKVVKSLSAKIGRGRPRKTLQRDDPKPPEEPQNDLVENDDAHVQSEMFNLPDIHENPGSSNGNNEHATMPSPTPNKEKPKNLTSDSECKTISNRNEIVGSAKRRRGRPRKTSAASQVTNSDAVSVSGETPLLSNGQVRELTDNESMPPHKTNSLRKIICKPTKRNRTSDSGFETVSIDNTNTIINTAKKRRGRPRKTSQMTSSYVSSDPGETPLLSNGQVRELTDNESMPPPKTNSLRKIICKPTKRNRTSDSGFETISIDNTNTIINTAKKHRGRPRKTSQMTSSDASSDPGSDELAVPRAGQWENNIISHCAIPEESLSHCRIGNNSRINDKQNDVPEEAIRDLEQSERPTNDTSIRSFRTFQLTYNDNINYTRNGEVHSLKFANWVPLDTDYRRLENIDVIQAETYLGDSYQSNSGYIRIRDEKPPVTTRSYLVYTVCRGSAEVQCNNRVCRIPEDGYFRIPVGAEYSIKNMDRNEDLLVMFTKIT